MQPLRPRLLAGLVLAALSLTACRKSEARPSQGVAPSAISVTLATVTNAAWDRTVSIVGNLYPKDTATVAAQVEGAVESTLVDFGDRVKAEQELATIDIASYEAQLQQVVGNRAKAEANLDNARRNFDRIRALRSTQVASDADLDAATAQLRQWEAELKAAQGAEGIAQLNLRRSRVKAPFDGAIAQRIVGRGDYVKVGAPLFEMVNDAVLKFIFQVPERFGSMVEKKLPVTFSVDNYPGEIFTGGVYLISPSVSAGSRSFNVGALVTNTNFRLKASSFARGELTVQRGVPTPVVPLEAIVSFAGVTKVFVVASNKAEGRTVVLGRVRDGLQEITGGLKEGEQVAITGQSKLSDGMTVTVQSPGSPAAPVRNASTPASHGRP